MQFALKDSYAYYFTSGLWVLLLLTLNSCAWCVCGNEEGEIEYIETRHSPWRVGNMTAGDCLSIVRSGRHHSMPHQRSLFDSSWRGGESVAPLCMVLQAHEVVIAGPPREKGAQGMESKSKDK